MFVFEFEIEIDGSGSVAWGFEFEELVWGLESRSLIWGSLTRFLGHWFLNTGPLSLYPFPLIQFQSRGFLLWSCVP